MNEKQMTDAIVAAATKIEGERITSAQGGYEVEKFGRGGDGKWFGYGARRFKTRDAAYKYLEDFVRSQARVLGAGLRIDLRQRRGRKVEASAGGLLNGNISIREIK